jgi:hypothetical protein
VLGRGLLRYRARHDRRRRPDGVANAAVPASFTCRGATGS